eukprot:TRINITY_DN4659_c0_g1_i2.p1 TRINITY_DN4659_c0_g1~~TRINITY_DN4659_c0_g1_i2.p1  ORF type:complete len:264 (-),score=52.84 TRINITY_DN4659_c0_g1_i2:284-1075(-)
MKRHPTNAELMSDTLRCICSLVRDVEDVPGQLRLSLQRKLDYVTTAICTCIVNDFSPEGPLVTASDAFATISPYYDDHYSQIPIPDRPHLIRFVKAGMIEGFAKIVINSDDPTDLPRNFNNLAKLCRMDPERAWKTRAHIRAIQVIREPRFTLSDDKSQAIAYLSQLQQYQGEHVHISRDLIELGVPTMLYQLLTDTSIEMPAFGLNETCKYMGLLWHFNPDQREKDKDIPGLPESLYRYYHMYMPSGDGPYRLSDMNTSILR